MALNLNKVFLAGRLCADPEVKTTTTGIPVCDFRVAVNRQFVKDGEEIADFFTVRAWRKQAEFIGKYFKKGGAIFIEGRAENRSWVGKDGTKHSVTEIIADTVSFVESRQTEQEQVVHTEPTQPPAGNAPQFEQVSLDEDLPF